MNLDAVYIAYWSLRDPLCQSQSLPVLRALARTGRRLGLITFEQRRWALARVEAEETRRALASEGIRWEPLRYHKRPPILSTLFDVVRGALRCVRLARTTRVSLFHGRGTVPAAMAYAASRLTGGRFFNDADGPLSQEYVDAGVWRQGSVAQRLTRWAETRFLRAANAVAVLTERRRDQVRDVASKEATVLPCAVDTSRFVRSPLAREALRGELSLEGVVLVYAGKAGGWYLTDEIVDFARASTQVLGRVCLLVLTNDDAEQFEEPARKKGVRCIVRSALYEEMPRYLSAGDAGLSFVLPAPSKAACSPVKNGEYLACGLPIVTTAGIGDYSELVARRRVGVVVSRLDAAGYREAALALRALLDDPALAGRCRAAAESEVGLSEVVVPRYLRLYESLVKRDGGRGA